MEVSDGEEEKPNPFSFEHFVKCHSTANGPQGTAKATLLSKRNSFQETDQSAIEDDTRSSTGTDTDTRSEEEEDHNPFSFENFVKNERGNGVYKSTTDENKQLESHNRQQSPSQQPPVLPEKEANKGLHGSNGGSKQHAPPQQAEIIDFVYDVPPARKTEDGESQRSNKSNTAGRKGEVDMGEDYMIPKGPTHQDYAVPRTTRATSHSHGSGSKGHKSDKHGSRARSNTAREDRKVNRKSKANTTHHDKHQNDKHSDNDHGPPEYDDSDVHVSIEDILSDTGSNGPHDVRRKTFTGIRPSEQKSNHKENGGVSSEMQRLKHENTKLKNDLQDSKRHREKESKKMREMESEIRRLKQREAEDAKALETMVQHVEDNLRRTTDRAVAAENHVSKLKQEVKHLKSHVHHLQSDQKPAVVTPAEENNGDLGAIRMKAQATSLKLASLSRDAEMQLKQLLGGVETLKVVAETLACIDKIVEDSDSRHSTAL